ncbi:MAG: hypothetical protein M0024_08620 [Nitrospiraceae bacterium]|nr:hypothetical protein [Nitrospiraceae bacterium]
MAEPVEAPGDLVEHSKKNYPILIVPVNRLAGIAAGRDVVNAERACHEVSILQFGLICTIQDLTPFAFSRWVVWGLGVNYPRLTDYALFS